MHDHKGDKRMRVPKSHTTYSWDFESECSSTLRRAVGHTAYSWGVDSTQELMNPVMQNMSRIKEMDALHAERYLFGEFSEDFKVDTHGVRNIKHWVCPWQPSPPSLVEGFLRLANVKSSDLVLDLGCGDGRVLTWCLQKVAGLRAIGVDISEECIECANLVAKDAGGDVSSRVQWQVYDFCDSEEELGGINEVTVVYIYLVQEALERVRSIVESWISKGKKVVTHEYHFKGMEPVAMDKDNDLCLYQV